MVKRHVLHTTRRPAGEGANIDRRLVPYTRDAMRTKSRIEFIYLYIQLFQLRLSPEQSGKVEYERERLAGNR